MIAKIVTLVLYAILIMAVGYIGSRKTKSFKDFLLGGGTVGPWMSALSYGTAYFSAVLFIGFAGKIGWVFGLSGLWIAVGNTLVGIMLVWLLIGKKVRVYATTNGVSTMPEFLEHRFDSKFLKLFSSLSIFIFFIPYTAAVFMGLSYLFTTTFGIQYEYILLFMGIFTGFYMLMGGYKSMALMDFIFGIIMTIGVAVIMWFVLDRSGGVMAVVDKLRAIDPDLASPVGKPGFWPLASLVFLTSVAPLAMPQLVQKFYAIKDDRSVKIGMVVSTVFGLLVTATAYFSGATGRLFVTPQTNPNAFADGKPVYDALMPEMLSNIIPPAFFLVILLLILAASMSTLASLVLISGATIAKDLYAGFLKKDASDKAQVFMIRAASAFFIVLSMILALTRPAVIVTILAISWGAIASVFLGPFMWGLFWKGTTRTGAIAGSVVGLAVCISLFVWRGEAFVAQAGSLGMLTSLAVVPVVSMMTGKPDKAAA
ncbi:MAG: sodium/solute symporter [Candidatus Brocadiia bacterium]